MSLAQLQKALCISLKENSRDTVFPLETINDKNK